MTTEDDRHQFAHTVAEQIAAQGVDSNAQRLSRDWMTATWEHQYSYHFTWLGMPIIQYPPDIVAIQELIWKVKPDLIIETGVARGGSLILSASVLALLDFADAAKSGQLFDPSAPQRSVLGVDIDIRQHNRDAIENHPLASRITMLEGSSVAPEILSTVHRLATDADCVMVFLDSNHTREHVLAELNAYGPLVSTGSYCVAFDTFIDDMPLATFLDRPWKPGDSPKTAVREFLASHPEFSIDKSIDAQLLISMNPEGYLRKN